MGACLSCGYDRTPVGKGKCYNCGAELDDTGPSPIELRICPSCGYAKTPPGSPKCFQCGARLAEDPPAQAPAGGASGAATSKPIPANVARELEAQLEPGEEVKLVINGISGQTLIATDKHVFIGKKIGLVTNQFLSWRLQDITAVETAQSGLTGYVAVVAPGYDSPRVLGRGPQRGWSSANKRAEATLPNNVVVRRVPATEVAALRALIAKAHDSVPAVQGATAPQPDAADQLRKLAALRNDGIITDAEFDAKKAELLSRM